MVAVEKVALAVEELRRVEMLTAPPNRSERSWTAPPRIEPLPDEIVECPVAWGQPLALR